MNLELVLAVITQVATAAGVYAAIRADLAKAIERATTAHDAARLAHERIDHLMRERP
jgi:hypothetical protein